MPELPEVETIRRQAEKELVGAEIVAVDVSFGGRIRVSLDEFRDALVGARIEEVRRRAKLLAFALSNGKSLLIHLKMTGRLLLGEAAGRHVHVVFRLDDGRTLRFEDIRKFGYLDVVDTERLESDVFSAYGPEPLSDGFTPEAMAARLSRRPGTRIKQALLDQACIAGIGNIYADETCWGAGVLPDRRVASLSQGELRGIWSGARESLAASVARHGTSADTYVDLYGSKGDAQSYLHVYGRDGESCERCGGIIKKTKLGGRGTHFCSGCQA